MISLLWLNYSIHQGFSVDLRESPELFVFLVFLLFFSLTRLSCYCFSISATVGSCEWPNQTFVLHISLHSGTLLSQEFRLWLSVELLHFPSALLQFNSVQFSHSVMSNSLWPHEPQHARPPYPSPTPRVYIDSCPLSRWCHLILCRPLLLLPSIFP